MTLILASALKRSAPKISFLNPDKTPRPILHIPTAVNPYLGSDISWQKEEMKAVQAQGWVLDTFDLVNKSTDQIREKLVQHNAIYVNGGNTFYLLQHMRLSGFVAQITSWYAQPNRLYMGSSAGAIVATRDIAHIVPMDEPMDFDLSDCRSLGLYQKNLVVHCDHPDYAAAAKVVADTFTQAGQSFTALNDDQILVINATGEEVL